MTTSKRSKKRSNVRNTPQEHHVSAVAHHLEEAINHLHAITHYEKKSVPKDERDHIFKLKRHLAVLHRRETKRRKDLADRD